MGHRRDHPRAGRQPSARPPIPTRPPVPAVPAVPAVRDRPRRQRPIRATLAVLLIIPLISLLGLWAYAAANTVGSALAKRANDAVNKDVAKPTQEIFQQLVTERAETFAWQSAQGAVSAMPRNVPAAQRARAVAAAAALHAQLVGQRRQTDAVVAAFRAGLVAAAGGLPAASRPVSADMLGKLNQLPGIRAAVEARTMGTLTAFQAYNSVVDEFFVFFRGGLTDPESPIQSYAEGVGAVDEGQAVEYIGREAALVGGALAGGGVMSPAEHDLFVQAVDDQRLVEQEGVSPLYWQGFADPYPGVLASGAYRNFSALEDRITAAKPGTPIPVTPAAWQSDMQGLVGAFTQAENVVSGQATLGAAHQGDVILLRLFIVGGVGLLAVLVSAYLLLRFGSRIARELTGLRGAARELADRRLPALVSRLRAGEDVDVDTEAPPLALRTRTREVTETADAFSAVRHTAVEAAVGQAQLRNSVNGVFRSLARRNQSLLQRQLKMLDEMERGTQHPDALAQLFRLDHLTTRMRRHAEGLIILSGAAPGRAWRQPVPVVEVLRGAVGEIEDYVRVDLVAGPDDFMHGNAVADVTHLLAELIENATQYSPPTTRVSVRASRVAQGYAVEVEDRGLGIPADVLMTHNDHLSRPAEFDPANSDQIGLLVVSRLAARHGIRVTLSHSAYGGTAAVVLMPHHLVVPEADATGGAGQGVMAARQDPRQTADEIRSLVSSIQQEWRSGRAAAEQSGGSSTDGHSHSDNNSHPG